MKSTSPFPHYQELTQALAQRAWKKYFIRSPGGIVGPVFSSLSPLVAFTAAQYQGGPNFVIYECQDDCRESAAPVAQSVQGWYHEHNYGLLYSRAAPRTGRWFIVQIGINFFPVVAGTAGLAYSAFCQYAHGLARDEEAKNCLVYDGDGFLVGQSLDCRWYEPQDLVGTAGGALLQRQFQVLTVGGQFTEVMAVNPLAAYQTLRNLLRQTDVPCLIFDGSQGNATAALAGHDGVTYHDRIGDDLLAWLLQRLSPSQ